MKKESHGEHEHRSDRDLKKFEEQPPEQKEVQQLKDLAEKSAGQEKANLHRKIRRRTDGKGG